MKTSNWVKKKKKKIIRKKILKKKRRIIRQPKRKEKILEKREKKVIIFKKHGNNPIIEPNHKNTWESKATFNPAAIEKDGKFHILYRAIGDTDMSVLGYASSKDGFIFDERLNEPAYISKKQSKTILSSYISPYISGGGGNGGCEDPRLSLIDDILYMIYTSFNGNLPRVALTSIKIDDFINKRWRKWKKSVLISKPGEVHKNWVIFPEKIKGKYAILHSISPEISIEYVDSLDFDGKTYIKSHYGYHGKKDKKRWDSWIRGAGPTPLKTKYGWLVLYHAMDRRDPDRYKLGAMILDAKNPAKVLHRSKIPLIEPDKYYENCGHKAGVVYSCGAIIANDLIYVYYGGADTVTCVAVAKLENFLNKLVADKKPVLKNVKNKKI